MRPVASQPVHHLLLSFFFFNDTATTEIYTLSLHDALPISLRTTCPTCRGEGVRITDPCPECRGVGVVQLPKKLSVKIPAGVDEDRKSTRLNSSHGYISYAVFCLKKKKKQPFMIP